MNDRAGETHEKWPMWSLRDLLIDVVCVLKTAESMVLGGRGKLPGVTPFRAVLGLSARL